MSLTLREVAKLANVSLATASRVINDRPGVRSEIRTRVWQIIRENSYQPNQAARSLAASKSRKDQWTSGGDGR